MRKHMDTQHPNETPVPGHKKVNRHRRGGNPARGRGHKKVVCEHDGVITDKTIEQWHPIEPDISREITALAGNVDAEDRVRKLAAHAYNALNGAVPASSEIERSYRLAASLALKHFLRIETQQAKEPVVNSVETTAFDEKPNPWQRFWGWLALLGLLCLVFPIPVVVAQGISQSFAFDPISEDWRLGLPVGLPVVAGILAGGLLRQTLSLGARAVYDRFVSVLGIAALAAWSGAYAYTFLAPFNVADIFAGGGGTDLRLFYGMHLGLEVTAALGLTAMAERAFSTGRKVVHSANLGVSLLQGLKGPEFQHHVDLLTKAETYADIRTRWPEGLEAYIDKCLAQLRCEQARLNADLAIAAANFANSQKSGEEK